MSYYVLCSNKQNNQRIHFKYICMKLIKGHYFIILLGIGMTESEIGI